MKKLTVLLMLLISLVFEAQTYIFDHLITYESTRIQPNASEPYPYQVAINSKNKDYILQIGQQGLGNILDFKTNENHQVSIIKPEKGNVVFSYLKTSKIKKDEKIFYYHSKINKSGEYVIQSFEDKKMRKLKNEVVVKVKEFPLNLLMIYGDISDQQHIEINQQLQNLLNPTKSYLIESEIMDYKNGYIFQYIYKNSQKFDLKIDVPEKRIN